VSTNNDLKLTTSQRERLDAIVPLAKEAYLFGYPLMVLDLTRRMMTNVPKIQGEKAPMKMIVHERSLPDGTSKDQYPNVDVLEWSAWLTVSKEPMVLTLPNVRGRFYCVSLYDGWGRIFHTMGTRTTGEWKGNYALVGRGFKEKMPKGVTKVVCPTNIVRVVGKVQCHLKEDVKVVDGLQDKIVLTPLDIFGKNNRIRLSRLVNRYGHHHIDRAISNDIPPTQYIDKMDPIYYFQSLCELMKENPPPTKERPFVHEMGELGMTLGHSYDLMSIDMIAHQAIENGTSKARKALVDPPKNPMVQEWEIWNFINRTEYQTSDHLQRAQNLASDLGLELPEDISKFNTSQDGYRRPLDGNNKYIIHFPKDALPPVNGFWSMTLYDSKNALVKNKLDRFSIGSLDKLSMNEDGSLDIYIQSFSPGAEKESNWLPAPMEPFQLYLSLYWPKDEVISKRWAPPLVTREDMAAPKDPPHLQRP